MKKYLRGLWFALTALSVGIIASVLTCGVIWYACQIFIIIHGILMYGG